MCIAIMVQFVFLFVSSGYLIIIEWYSLAGLYRHNAHDNRL